MQRQFRSDDTSGWAEKFGNGSDGDLTISSSQTETVIDSTFTGSSGASSGSGTNASFAIGQIVAIWQTQGVGSGNWELNKIVGYTAGTINFKYPLTNDYVTGAQIRVIKQYRNVTIDAGVVFSSKRWDGDVGGLCFIMSSGILTINGTINGAGDINSANGGSDVWQGGYGIGFSAGIRETATQGPRQGDGTSGKGSKGNNARNGNGGGSSNQGSSGVGGGGGHATAGSDGNNGAGGTSQGGEMVGNASLTSLNMGGGAGGSGATGGVTGVAACGGGAIVLIAKKVIIDDTTGLVTTDGGSGQTGNNIGGSGGAGGAVLVKTQIAQLGTSKVTANKGTGSSGSTRNGVDGSVGRIHVDYLLSISGTTSPSADTSQDNVLRAGGFSGQIY